MRKLNSIFIILLVAIMMIGLFGCTSQDTAVEQKPEEQKSQEEKPEEVSTQIESFELKIRSGSTSGTLYPATGAMAQFLPDDIPELKITITPGAGQSNVQAVQDGIANFATGKIPSTMQGLNGVPPFTAKTDKVRHVVYLYDEAFHLVVRADSGINSVADLKGKSLTTQTTGNLAEQMTREVLEAYGLTYKDLKRVSHVGYEDSVQQMKDGIVDAFTFATAAPASVLVDLATARDVKLIPIGKEQLAEVYEMSDGYMDKVIPKGTYKDQDTDIQTFGCAIHMMAPTDLSEDMVYKLTKSIVENRERIGEAHVIYKGLTPELMGMKTAVPFHPGAEKYFKEIGVLE